MTSVSIRLRIAAVLFLLTIIKPVPVPAAEVTVYDITFSLDTICAAGDTRCPSETKARYAALIGGNRWEVLFKKLKQEFEDSPVDWSNNEIARRRFLNELDSLVDRCKLLPQPLEGVATREYYDAFLEPLSFDRFKSESNDSADIVFFKGRGNQIVLGYTNAQDELVKLLTEDQALDLRLRANTIKMLEDIPWHESVKANLKAVQHAETRWANYLDHGFSQYPWEAWINGWATPYTVESPPGHQFAVLHPDAALELGPLRTDDATVKETLTLAVLGWIDYYGYAGESFWGISGAMSFRDDMGLGIGGLLYFGSTASIGVMWHDRNRDAHIDSRPFICVSLDLFRLAGVKGGSYLEKTGLLKIRRETLEAKVAEYDKAGS